MEEDPIDKHLMEAYQNRKQRDKTPSAVKIAPTYHNIDITNRDHTKTLKEQGLEQMLMKMNNAQMDVAKVYSPERVTTMAKNYGLQAGWALDLTAHDENGKPGGFDCAHMRNKDTSPTCTDFCAWAHLNHSKVPREAFEERLRKARVHLRFCTRLDAIQIQHGRYFLHERPLGATSWKARCVQNIFGKHGVVRVIADQCRYGLIFEDRMGHGMVRKAVGFVTTPPCLAMELQKRCPNRSGKVHQIDTSHWKVAGPRPRRYTQTDSAGLYATD